VLIGDNFKSRKNSNSGSRNMQTSNEINEIAGALALAQMEIENASKNSANPHFRSKYADLAEVLNTVRPVFAKHGIAVIQAPEYGEGVAHVQTTLAHKSGQWMRCDTSAPVTKQDAQGIGSAITYCRRYGLAAMAGVAQEDDDANAAVAGPGKKAQEQQAAEHKKALAEAIAKHQDSIDAIKQGIKDGDLSAAAEAWFELSQEEMASIWAAPSNGGPFTTKEREVMKSSEFRKAHYGEEKESA
jgi:hypothetical protein